jgi:TonB-linked SusC/RagA family outer membrane protein
MKKLTIFLAFMLFAGFVSQAQMQISGTVLGAEDGLSVPGVSVVVKDNPTIGTTTDMDGKYTLTVPSTSQVLVFSFVGMKTQEVSINGRTVIDVQMESEVLEMEEVMVVAYGSAKKESFTGSAKQITSDNIEKRTITSVTSALEGVIPGVQTTSGGGSPGSAPAIRIRGIGSINASSSPLYVVDGIPYDGNINAINQDDVASMSVLKDASASALYGARGANGVIMITTKRGSTKDPEIRFKATFGTTSRAVEAYETVDAKTYMELFYEGYRNQLINDGETPADATTIALNGDGTRGSYMEILGGEGYNPFNVSSESLIDPATGKVVSGAEMKYKPNWFDEATRDDNMRSDYQLSINGGSEKTKYLISLGYLNDKGIVSNSQFNRYNGRINLDSELKEWLKAGMSTSYSLTERNYLTDAGTSYNNIWYSTLAMAPIYPVYEVDASGDYILDSQGKKIYDYGETRPYASNFNSIATLYDDSRTIKYDNLSGRIFMSMDTEKDIPVIKDLKFDINLGYDYNHGDRLIYNNPFHGDSRAVHGSGMKFSYRTLSYTFNQLLTYKKAFGDHHFDLLAGHEYYDYSFSQFSAEKQNYLFEGLTELDGAATTVAAGSYSDKYRVESYLSRLNYDFANKYYLSFSYRTDGSSRFNKDVRWGEFWSVGGSWRVSEETFMKSFDWLTNMTLKGSYGSQGNDALLNADGTANYYAWQSFYSSSWANSSYGGVWLSSLENKEVEWEKNKNFNIGLESNFLNRISFSAEYFHKTTSDLLLFRPLATSTGFDGYWDNIGEMINYGMDFDLSAQVLTGDLKWTFGTQLSFIRNEVTKLVTEDQELVDGNYIITLGEPINSFYLPTSAGIDPLTGEQLYLIKERDEDGKIIDERITNDYLEAAQYKEIQGSRIPDYYGSITNTFTYKGIDLSVLVTYSVGGYVLDGVYSTLFSTRDAGSNYHQHMTRRWQEPGDVTDVPKIVLGQVNYTTDARLIDASYLAIKNVTLGYTLPASINKKIGINSLRIFFTGDNLAIFSKLQGMDPQYNFAGGQNFSYTPLQVLSVGLDVKF